MSIKVCYSPPPINRLSHRLSHDKYRSFKSKTPRKLLKYQQNQKQIGNKLTFEKRLSFNTNEKKHKFTKEKSQSTGLKNHKTFQKEFENSQEMFQQIQEDNLHSARNDQTKNGSPFNTLRQSCYYSRQRQQLNEKQKNDAVEIQDQISKNLQRLQFFIDKAEQVQYFRQRSSSQKYKRHQSQNFNNDDNQKQGSKKTLNFQSQNNKNESIFHRTKSQGQDLNNNLQFGQIDQINKIEQSDDEVENNIIELLSCDKQDFKQQQNSKSSLVQNLSLSKGQFNIRKSLITDFDSQMKQVPQQASFTQQVNLNEIQNQDLINEILQQKQENKKQSSKNKHLCKKVVDLKCQVKMLERQIRGQEEIQSTQNRRTELIIQDRSDLLEQVDLQQKQISNMKNLLNQSLETKMKYENIFRSLLNNSKCREVVLDLIQS